MVESTSEPVAGSTGTPGGNAGTDQRDAIIFVPGLSREYLDQSVDCVSRKIANALERHAKAADAIFLARDSADAEYNEGEGSKAKKRTIVCRNPGGEKPFLDIYELNYDDKLTKPCKDRKPISQAIMLLLTLASNVSRLPQLIRGAGKSRREKFQIVFSMGILGIFAVYAVMLILAALSAAPAGLDKIFGEEKRIEVAVSKDAGAESKNASPPSEAAGTPKATVAKESGASGGIMDLLRNLIVLFTGLGLFTSKQLKDFIRSAAIDYSCALDYLALGERKRAILGELTLLVGHVGRNSQGYRKIHVVSFSFGSLVTLDAFFPADEYFPCYDGVDSLVTIGCPFDLVRNCWPEYFSGRSAPDAVQRKWFNIYNPIDILGSNFRNDDKADVPQFGIEIELENRTEMLVPDNVAVDRNRHLDALSFIHLVALRGLRVHTTYWDPDDKAELSCFDEIIKKLYPDL